MFAGTKAGALSLVGELSHKTPANEMEKEVVDMGIDLDGIKAKYVKIIAHSIGNCPDWHQGAGGKSWIFSDEIMVN